MKQLIIIFLPFVLFSCHLDNSIKDEKREFLEALIPGKYDAGLKVYDKSCVLCHQESGVGVEGAFPPLAQSDYLLEDKSRAIQIAANGMDGEIVVNGITYNSIMSPQGLSDEEVKDVVNYILNAWGNNGGEVTNEDVKKALKH